MIHVMDGVRPSVRRQQTIVLSQPKPAVAALSPQPRAYTVGMDGIRRPVMPTPREAVVNMQAAAMEATPVWQMPSLRLPQIAWKRPAIAFGLVATALVASTVMVGALTTPSNSTARASERERTRAKRRRKARCRSSRRADTAKNRAAAAIGHVHGSKC